MNNEKPALERKVALTLSEQSVSTIRILMHQRDALFARLQLLRDRAEDESGASTPLSTVEQVALSMGQTLQVFAGTHIDAALSCLAHNPKAFDAIKGEIEPSMVEHFLDGAKDDIAYGPLQGFSPDATVTSDLLMVPEHVRAANGIHERIFQLLAQVDAQPAAATKQA